MEQQRKQPLKRTEKSENGGKKHKVGKTKLKNKNERKFERTFKMNGKKMKILNPESQMINKNQLLFIKISISIRFYFENFKPFNSRFRKVNVEK